MHRSNLEERALRASFIITVASVVGCASARPEPEVTHNPPMPTATTPSVVIATAEPVTEPTPPDLEPDPPDTHALPDAPTDRPGRVQRSGDTCTWIAQHDPAPCPEGAHCNPPPPESFEVKCPKLPAAPDGAIVRTAGDGTCYYVEPREPMNCPTRMRCNPPPPKRHKVRCRDDE